jgi:hypothetical protein
MIALIAIVSAMVYVFMPFRTHTLKTPATPQSSQQTSSVPVPAG